MMTAALADMDLASLAVMLFTSPLQPSQHPSRTAITQALEAQFCSCRGNPLECMAAVAQEAGDRPELYTARMHWARQSVRLACPGRFPAETGMTSGQDHAPGAAAHQLAA